MTEENNAPAEQSTASDTPQQTNVTEAQNQRALGKSLLGSGAADFPMDVQMSSVEPTGSADPGSGTAPGAAQPQQAAPAASPPADSGDD